MIGYGYFRLQGEKALLSNKSISVILVDVTETFAQRQKKVKNKRKVKVTVKVRVHYFAILFAITKANASDPLGDHAIALYFCLFATKISFCFSPLPLPIVLPKALRLL